MTGRKPDEQVSDSQAERRATAALRRALTTPYKPQAAMKIGKAKAKPRRARKSPRSP
jgi:hypothetical protein